MFKIISKKRHNFYLDRINVLETLLEPFINFRFSNEDLMYVSKFWVKVFAKYNARLSENKILSAELMRIVLEYTELDKEEELESPDASAPNLFTQPFMQEDTYSRPVKVIKKKVAKKDILVQLLKEKPIRPKRTPKKG